MGPSGTPFSSAQSVLPPAVLQPNSAGLRSQEGPMPPQDTFSSVNLRQARYDMNLLGNDANISSLLNQTYGNGGKITDPSGLGGSQLGNANAVAGTDPRSTVATDVGFTAAQSSFMLSNMANSGSSVQVQNQQMSNYSGNAMLLDQQQSYVQKFEQQNLQHVQQSMQQFPTSNSQPQPQQPQFQSIQGSLGGMGPIKLGPQKKNEHIGSQQPLHSLGNPGPVNQDLQQSLIGRGIGPVKVEQYSDQSMLLQQQQFFHLRRQSSQGVVSQMNLLQQQRVLQLQQQQQQQLLKALPQQQPRLQQHFQHHNLPSGSVVRPVYEPGMCARRLTQYMYQQQQRPNDNSVEFWQKFVAEFFAPNAKKRWCVSLYGNNGVFPQDTRQCEICNHKPGRGFEATVEVLPRLFKVKYDSGTLEELLYVDMPHEYQNATGQIILDYAKAIQESVFDQLRVVHDGRLHIVFSPDLKICSWEFCARHHEELIPRRLIMPPVSQLGAAAQKYQASAASHPSSPHLQSNCNTFVTSARQLAKALEVPLVNDLGYTKRFVRCLQIAEVVSSMKDLIDFTQGTGKGPMETLAQFARRSTADPSSVLHLLRPEEQQQNNMKSINGLTPLSRNSISSGNGLVRNGIANGNSDIGSGGLGNLGVATSPSGAANGIRGTNANNFGTFTGRGGMLMMPQLGSSMNHQQQELVNRSQNGLGLGAVNGFNNFQYEWKLP